MKSICLVKLLYILISMLIFLKSSLAIDFITSTQTLRDNETLVSSNGIFELGFFSTNNPNNRYLGLWYKQVPLQRVWVANRNHPIIDSYGLLTITTNTNIALLNRSSSTIWSTNLSSTGPKSQLLLLQLLDSGNLVLTENSITTTYLWQSFDHPCDTLLPGMKMSWNVETGQERFLTSWKDIDDVSNGDSVYKIDKLIMPQMTLFSGSKKRFRTGPWDGVRFMGVRTTASQVHTVFMGFDDHEYSYTFKRNIDSAFATVVMITPSGSIQRLVLNDSASVSWYVLYSIPNEPCNIYGNCGANGVCTTSKGSTCECLQGFVPKSLEEWKASRWSTGCALRTKLECNSNDRFNHLLGVKFPDLLKYRVNESMSLEECKVECLRDCSCSAYANSDIRSAGSGCVMWFGDLIDMRYLVQDETKAIGLGLYIRLAASELKTRNNKVQIIVIVSAITFFITLLGITIWCLIRKREAKRRDLASKKEGIDLPLFGLATIASATKNFSEESILGEGGFGPVYKGSLSTGQEIAVKRLSKDSGQGIEEFKNEVVLIAQLQHRNLVALLGCCIQGEERMLVYEYMSNKSLDRFIFARNRSKPLDWDTRLRIIMGIARGLLYLHHDSKLQIIHRDLKASNILLDSNMNPKISDFGLARIFRGGEIETKTKKVIGTYGYMSPEYAVDGKFSVKSDVFSFGVVLLEIISGQRNRGFSHPNHHHNLLGHAWLLWNEDEAFKLADFSFKDLCVKSQVVRCIQIGLLCVQKFPLDRPTMVSVVLMLSNDETTLSSPKEPAFFVERSSVGVDQTQTKEMSCAQYDETTVTLYEGR